MQSHDYVPGVSGWKLDPLKGDFEFNSCTLGSASSAPQRQMVSVEVASYSKCDLPKNAANLLQFMQSELQRVPEEYRHAAEFEGFDASYGDESFNARLFLSYSRLETEDELADRLQKAKGAGIQIKSDGGVTTFTHDGVLRIRIGNLAAPEPKHGTADQPAKPFVVVDGTTYLSEAFIKDSTITSGKIGELEDRVDTLHKGLDQLNLERIGEKDNADGASILLERRLASIDHRLASLESNRFRRPHTS